MWLNVIIYIPLVGPNGSSATHQFLCLSLFCSAWIINGDVALCYFFFFKIVLSTPLHNCVCIGISISGGISSSSSAAAVASVTIAVALFGQVAHRVGLGEFWHQIWFFFFFFPCHIPTGRKTAALQFFTGVKARKKLTSLLRIHPEGSSETSFQKTERRHICCIRRWTPLTINLIARFKFYPPELGQRDKSNFVSRLIRWARRPRLRTTRISIFSSSSCQQFFSFIFFFFLSLCSPHKEIGGCPGVHFNDRTDPKFCLLLSSAVLTACDKPQTF